MEMKSFNKTNPKKKVIILSTIVIGITISLVCISFAFYQKESSFNFINATIKLLSAKEVSYSNSNYDGLTNVWEALDYFNSTYDAEEISYNNDNYPKLTNVKEALDCLLGGNECEEE